MTQRAGARKPLYARVLRLRYIQPGAVLCAIFFEGSIALAILLSLAELVNWWSVLLLPAIVAASVKVNDWIKGAYARSDVTRRIPLRRRSNARGVAPVRRGEHAHEDPHEDAYDDLDGPTEVLPTRRRRKPPGNQRRFGPPVGSRSTTDRDRGW